MSIFNNKNLYPTPSNVLDQMTFGVDLKNKVIFEPSAGSGNIVDYCLLHGAKSVLCCEISDDLAKICGSKGQLIGKDFLEIKSDQISHVDLIISNPPFDNDEKHILHMWEIAPQGCEIISLCNYETYSNHNYSRYRNELKILVDKNGNIQNLGDCFSDAERKTNVSIGLIHLYKPKEGDSEFDGYFDLSEEYEQQDNGIMEFNEIRAIVNRYVGAVKMFDNVMEANSQINSLIEPIRSDLGITFGAVSRSNQYGTVTRDFFKKELQKSAWKTVFNKLKMQKYVTKKVMDEINKFVHQNENVPFTLSNIYKMMEMIVGTHGQRMGKVIVEAFDRITSHAENRMGRESWKTNDQWMVNRKFILPGMVESNYSGNISISHYYHSNHPIDDVHKALCYLTVKNYEEIGDIFDFMHRVDPEYMKSSKTKRPTEQLQWGKWFEFGFFRMKGYMKGTLHCEFLDEKVWEIFNIEACKAKGWQLGEDYTHDFRKKTTGVNIYK
jgi:predicted RNA methylase